LLFLVDRLLFLVVGGANGGAHLEAHVVGRPRHLAERLAQELEVAALDALAGQSAGHAENQAVTLEPDRAGDAEAALPGRFRDPCAQGARTGRPQLFLNRHRPERLPRGLSSTTPSTGVENGWCRPFPSLATKPCRWWPAGAGGGCGVVVAR